MTSTRKAVAFSAIPQDFLPDNNCIAVFTSIFSIHLSIKTTAALLYLTI